MKSSRIVFISLLAILVGIMMFLFVAYRLEPKSPSKTLLAEQGVNDGFQLTMTLEKANYAQGETVNITLTLTNISNQTATIQFGPDSNQSLLYFIVYNSTHSMLYDSVWQPSSPGEIEVTEPFEIGTVINSGESLSGGFSWLQQGYGYNMTRGTYYIIGKSEFSNEANLQKPITIDTAPIQITIN